MKNLNKIVCTIILALSVSALSVSCYLPSPLYGTWSDNVGNTITFLAEDQKYSSTITESGNTKNESGTYNVIENVIVFKKDGGGTTNAEWDLRGKLLYITWTDETGTKTLTLYQSAK